jgi:Leucine-rich repeat (LRR) protein
LLSETLILKEAGWLLGKEPNKITNDDFKRINFIIIGDSHADSGVDYDQGSIIRLRDFNTNTLSDIKVLEKFTNLERLYLQSIRWPDNKIPKWMKFLAKYGILNLDKRFKIDLKPIEKLQKLHHFGIIDTPVSNFESVKNLTNLKSLTLYSTNVSDLEPLKKLTNLKSLFIRKCPNITDRQVEELQKMLPNLKIIR